MKSLFSGACLYFSIIAMQPAYSQDGSLDPSFDSDGIVVTDLQTGQTDACLATYIQADQKILVSGYSYTANFNTAFSLTRYLSDGSLDNTFDSDGIVITDIPANNAYAYSIAVQSDGKIVLAGMIDDGSFNTNILMIRYLSDGSLDTGFDQDGIMVLDLGGNEYAIDHTIDAADRIVLAVSGGNLFNVVRLNTDGSFDNSFGNGSGYVSTSVGPLGSSNPSSLVIQPDGKIVVCGDYQENGVTAFAVVRYEINGDLDLSFSDDGIVTNHLSVMGDNAETVAIDEAGKIIVGGSASTFSAGDYGVVRYNSDGTPDMNFGTNGVALIDYMGFDNSGLALDLQLDGKIVLLGDLYNNLLLTRLNYDGSIDLSFDNDGFAETSIPNYYFAYGNNISIQDNHDIIVASSDGDNYVARFNGSCVAPEMPASIVGDLAPCVGSTVLYSYTENPGAAGFSSSWILLSGSTGTASGNNLALSLGSTSGILSVSTSNNCGASPYLQVNINPVSSVPAMPSAISGLTLACSGLATTYSVTAISGATSYTWTLPNGWTGSSTSNSISVTAGSLSGNISVTANNSCGSSTPRTLAVTSSSALPGTPGSISGPTLICASTDNTYSIASVNGATSYTWTSPNGWTGVSSTNSISLNSSASSGNITVIANNSCGSSSAQNLAITVVPSIPATPTVINGLSEVCAGTNSNYSVSSVNGATSYTWTLPSGWSGTSSTNSINASTNTQSGTISVSANNICGSSPAQTLTINTISIPAQVQNIAGPTMICPNSDNIYTATASNFATSYLWTLPNGWTGSSTTDNIVVNTGSTGGNITVIASNMCGDSSPKTLTVNMYQVPVVTITAEANISCFGAEDGSISYALSGTSDGYSFSWNTGSTDQTLSAIGAGTYIISGTNGTCVVSSSLNVAEPAEIAINPVVTNTSACGQTNGAIALTVSGGSTSNYLYTWTGTQTGSSGGGFGNSFTINNIPAGNYIINVTNGSCSNQTIVSVAENGTPPLTISELTPITCPGSASGVLKVTSTGSLSGYSFTWSNGATGNQISNLAQGFYSVIGTNGTCTLTESYSLQDPVALEITGTIGISSIDATVNGGTGNLSYSWSGPNGFSATTEDINQLTATGVYTLTATDSKACTESQQFNLNFVGLDENETTALTVSLYPNPVNDFLNLNLPANIKSIFILDQTGKTIVELSTIETEQSLDVSNLANGVYFIKLLDAKASLVNSEKFVVIH